ncbi:MAG: 4'-phosphopantetheinyl transferase superfamily protein [Defluviitaleaceae bacterium]|nr:4'-phosphopantetheinyl transferase superfamily protein [Defluviitaleaceae bacterium]
MIKVYAVNINEPISSDDYINFLSHIADENLNKIKKFRFIEDSKRTLYGDLMIRYLVCKNFNILNKHIKYRYNEFGKPYILNCSKNDSIFEFNISHSGQWVVCAISKFEVGIDIEKIVPIDLNVALDFFSKSEYTKLMSVSENIKLNYFYSIWTLKESYIKFLGKGLSVLLDSFSVCVEKDFVIDFYKEYKLAIYTENDEFPKKIEILKIADIVKEII